MLIALRAAQPAAPLGTIRREREAVVLRTYSKRRRYAWPYVQLALYSTKGSSELLAVAVAPPERRRDQRMITSYGST